MVDHKGIGTQPVLEACRAGPAAKLVFFTVATAKAFGVKQADCIQSLAADEHAKAYCSGDFGVAAIMGLRHGLAQCRQVQITDLGVTAKDGVSANFCVIGKRRDCGGVWVSIDAGYQALKPIGRDLGIGVEQDDIVPAQGHAAIDGLHKTQIAFVLQVQHTLDMLGLNLHQIGGNAGVCGSVIDQHNAGMHRRQTQNAVQAANHIGIRVVNWNNDVDHAKGFRRRRTTLSSHAQV